MQKILFLNSGTTTWEHPSLHGAMRLAYQLIQRKDFCYCVVLVDPGLYPFQRKLHILGN